jgi:hypothetical protein
MGYTNVALKEKIIEMFPEIAAHGITTSLDFSMEKKAYVIKMTKGRHELITYLEKKNADECMDGVKCVHLGIQIGQFIKNFESEA